METYIRSEKCPDEDPSTHTEYRFEVTGIKKRFNNCVNFCFHDIQKALDLFNTIKEGTLWMVKVKYRHNKIYIRGKNYGSSWYSPDGPRKMMMRKGLQYMDSLR